MNQYSKNTPDGELIKACKKVTGQSCSQITWKTYEDCATATPPNDTIAILVRVRAKRGSIYIHDAHNNVGPEGGKSGITGKIVLVPWTAGNQFTCVGKCEVGYALLLQSPS